MDDFLFETVVGKEKPYVESLRKLLGQFRAPFTSGDDVGIKLHWGNGGIKAIYLLTMQKKSPYGLSHMGQNHLSLIQLCSIPVAAAPARIP